MRVRAAALLILLILPSTACSPAALAALGAGLQGLGQGMASSSTGSKLMIFGGEDHKTYLGCLNCGEYDSESLLNKYGSFGSAYSAASIFNKYGLFGSKYSALSVCNPYATEPPVIVDQAGNFYGRLTLNKYHHQATKDVDLLKALTLICE